jgi:hypothetical protein
VSSRRNAVALVTLAQLALGVPLTACGFDGEGSFVSTVAPAEPAPMEPRHPSLPPSGSAMPAKPSGADGGADSSTPVTSCSDPTLSFDGVDDFATVTDDSQLDLGGDFTVEAWIKPGANVTGGAEMDIVTHYDRNDSQGWALYVRSGRVAIAVWGTESFSSTAYAAGNQGSTYVVAGKWAHIAGTKQGDTLRIYYDGVLRDTMDLPFLFGRDTYSGPLLIGRAAYVADYHFQGEIDDVRLSNTARYTGNTAPKPTAALPVDSGTIASWRFDETSGTKLIDGKGAHDGSLAADTTAPARVASTCIANR